MTITAKNVHQFHADNALTHKANQIRHGQIRAERGTTYHGRVVVFANATTLSKKMAGKEPVKKFQMPQKRSPVNIDTGTFVTGGKLDWRNDIRRYQVAHVQFKRSEVQDVSWSCGRATIILKE